MYAVTAARRFTPLSSASDNRPTDPVSPAAVPFIPMVMSAARIESAIGQRRCDGGGGMVELYQRGALRRTSASVRVPEMPNGGRRLSLWRECR